MKILTFCLNFILALPACCFGLSSELPIVYVVEESSVPNTLLIHVDREQKSPATKLILSGPAVGVAQQIKELTCDNQPIKDEAPGIWPIPANCQKIQWQVPLIKAGEALASAQQSMTSGHFLLISTASSLPRLQDSNVPARLKLSLNNMKLTYPPTNTAGDIILPDFRSAPLFVLINPTLVGTRSLGAIKLTYLLDNPASITALPSMFAHMKGLQWMNTIFHRHSNEVFTVAWLGISASRVSLGGATGSHILLANYATDGQLPFGQAMLLYVPLHEAFHQFTIPYHEQPAWIAESLASYYGLRALQTALPNDPSVSALLDHTLANAKHFHNGLLTINRKVEQGDRSEYGAFYTKGVAFWMAVEKILQQHHQGSLDQLLATVLQTNNKGSDLASLQSLLGMSPENWSSLRHQFLD